jgi:hypothetical protein
MKKLLSKLFPKSPEVPVYLAKSQATDLLNFINWADPRLDQIIAPPPHPRLHFRRGIYISKVFCSLVVCKSLIVKQSKALDLTSPGWTGLTLSLTFDDVGYLTTALGHTIHSSAVRWARGDFAQFSEKEVEDLAEGTKMVQALLDYFQGIYEAAGGNAPSKEGIV